MASDDLERVRAALGEHYVVERELGSGGMATVYLAHDRKHDRRVAVKVLRPDLSAILGAERFLREIKVTATLQHPHILQLYDSGSVDGIDTAPGAPLLYYVMPYVEGETLRQKLAREGQLSIEESVEIAKGVASALDYAHRHDVIHRDIKPENILLLDGQPLVADFGIALAVTSVGGTRLTETGLSIGTPQYMSPEQASGQRDIGPKSDIFALGTIVYEMLAGEPPFNGPSAQSVLAKVLSGKPPPIADLRPAAPPHLAQAVHKALAPLPADRFSSASKFADALSGGQVAPTDQALTTSPRFAWIRDWRSQTVLTALVVSLIALMIRNTDRSVAPAGTARFVVSLPDQSTVLTDRAAPVALSHDGSRLVYVGRDETIGPAGRRLYLRTLDNVAPIPISGSDSADAPFISPDDAWVGFFVRTSIRKVPIAGGAAVTIVETTRKVETPAVWLDDNTIVFTNGWGQLTQINADGGTPRVLIDDTTRATGGATPLPNGRGVLIWTCALAECVTSADLAAIDFRTGKMKTVLERFAAGYRPPDTPVLRYLSTGHILFSREDGSLAAVPFDLDHLEVRGTPVTVLDGLLGQSRIATADNGTIAYVSGSPGESQIVEVDRFGAWSPITDRPLTYIDPALSPDEGEIAVEIHDTSGGHIWVYDIASHTLSRLTSQGHNRVPSWSPDGQTIAYLSGRDTLSGLYTVPADRRENERLLYRYQVRPGDQVTWSPDGRTIAFSGLDRFQTSGMFFIDADGGDSRPMLETAANERAPKFSPDGRWIAYISDESGRPDLYVRESTELGGRWIVSNGVASSPVWAPSGRELIYRRADTLYAASLEFAGEPRVLDRRKLLPLSEYVGTGFDVFRNSRTFAMVREVQSPVHLIMVLNWIEEFRNRTGLARRDP